MEVVLRLHNVHGETSFTLSLKIAHRPSGYNNIMKPKCYSMSLRLNNVHNFQKMANFISFFFLKGITITILSLEDR